MFLRKINARLDRQRKYQIEIVHKYDNLYKRVVRLDLKLSELEKNKPVDSKIRDFKANDKVFDLLFGWGVIESIDNSSCYPLKVRFNPKELAEEYTLDGRYFDNNSNPTLSHNEYGFNTQSND